MSLYDSSVLFVTLDYCRYDTLAEARTPSLLRAGPLHKAMAPSHFTFGSHASMFAGFTPGLAAAKQRFLNPKFGRFFRLEAGFPGQSPAFVLSAIGIRASRLSYDRHRRSFLVRSANGGRARA
jgi:hypothetical protein